MGTRGTVGFMIDGTQTASYNQYDSYPEGVGTSVLEFARTLTDHLAFAEAAGRARRLVSVDESGKPTAEQASALAQFTNTAVSTGSDWYSTLRECQGFPGKILESGFILDSLANFGEEEYDWQIDFDARMFRGFINNSEIVAYSLDALPTDEAFAAEFRARMEVVFAD